MEERKENVGVARAAIVLVCKHSTCWRNIVFGGETQLSRLLQIRQNCWNAVISRFYVWQTPVHPSRPCSCQAVEMIGARSLFNFNMVGASSKDISLSNIPPPSIMVKRQRFVPSGR